MSRASSDVLRMEHPDGPSFLSFTLTHRERGLGTNHRGRYRYSYRLYRNPQANAPNIQTAKLTREFRAIVAMACDHARQQLSSPTLYRFAAGYFYPQSQAVPVPETVAAFAPAIMFYLREPQEPAAQRLSEFLQAIRGELQRMFDNNPTAVFPKIIWVIVTHPQSKDQVNGQDGGNQQLDVAHPQSSDQVVRHDRERREILQPEEAAFEKLCFPLRVSPYPEEEAQIYE